MYVPYFKEIQTESHMLLKLTLLKRKMSYQDLGHKASGWEKRFPLWTWSLLLTKDPHISGLKLSHCCWNSKSCKDAQKTGYLFFILKYVLFATFDLKWGFCPLWFFVSLVFAAAACWMAQMWLPHCFKHLCAWIVIVLNIHTLRILSSSLKYTCIKIRFWSKDLESDEKFMERGNHLPNRWFWLFHCKGMWNIFCLLLSPLHHGVKSQWF